jgi:transglutaminase-like putative cysteine protease
MLVCTALGCGSGSTNSAASPEANDGDAAGPAVREYWDAQFLKGAKVGYSHTRISSAVEDGQVLKTWTNTTRLTVSRDGQELTQELVSTSVETPQGRIVRFDTSVGGGGGETRIHGHLRDDELVAEVKTQGQAVPRTIAWDPAWGGFFAVEQSLERKPMQPGERRKLTALMPFFVQPAKVFLEAYNHEETALLDGKQELLRIKKTLVIPGSDEIVEWIWCDRTGQPLRSELVGGLGGESYRTTRQIAVRPLDEVAFDLFNETTIKIEPPLANPHRTGQIVYHVRLKDGDPTKVFATDPRQSSQRTSDDTARLVVRASGLRNPAPGESTTDRPTAADREPNSLVQSNDQRIEELAAKVAPDEKDERRVVAALEAFVGRYITRKNFSQALATAAEVAATRQGDCTEHAVLLAALCRARGTPARVAIGLVYSEKPGGFAYHMWNEVFVGDQWVPLDATLGMEGVGAAHLKIRHTNLHGVSPYAAFLPVYQVLGQLEIEIIEVR